MPTFPFDHDVALICSLPSTVVKPLARPLSQSMTKRGLLRSVESPEVGQPVERPVPAFSASTAANPRGTHAFAYDARIGGFSANGLGATGVRCGGVAPSSCSTFQLELPLVGPI